MTAPAFTPGPWQAEPMGPLTDNSFYITATPDGNNSAKDVATVGPCLSKTTSANARLIAAAPELYEALAEMVSDAERNQRPGGGDTVPAKAYLALAKVEAERTRAQAKDSK